MNEQTPGRLDGAGLRLYAFTLESHFRRTVTLQTITYRLPGGRPPPLAHSLNELRQLMDSLTLAEFSPEDREGDGLVLVLNPAGFQLPAGSAVNSGIPIDAIKEKLVAHRRIVFDMPERLASAAEIPLGSKSQLKLALAVLPLMAAFSAILGFILASVSRGLPLESTSQWLGYFLIRDNFLMIWLVAGLFCLAGLYLISSVRAARGFQEYEPRGGDWRQSLLQLGLSLDLLPRAVALPWRVTWMALFFVLGVSAIMLWYAWAPAMAVEFRVVPAGETAYTLVPFQQLTLQPDQTIDLQVMLPPNRQSTECRWSSASGRSRIDPLPGCRAVYRSPASSGEDQIVVEFYDDARRYGDALLIVRIP